MASKGWFYAGAAILLLLAAAALFAPALAPYNPFGQNLDQDLIARSREHWLGTDKLGRDILSRIIYGGRISLLVGITTVALSLAIGVVIGSLSGYFGGWIDQMLMRLVDILMAFPGILLAIAFTAVLGPGLDHVILALCLIGWLRPARARRDSFSARTRFHSGGALSRLPSEAHYFAPFAAESAAAAFDSKHFWFSRCDCGRRELELSRTRRRTTDAVLGRDAERWPAILAGRTSSHHVPRARAHDHRARVESCRRRAAGTVTNAQALDPFK
jgi:Binding-protein-dependent transport system inner membrane component/N-terminal TM domain of oligopeptide transport permease C